MMVCGCLPHIRPLKGRDAHALINIYIYVRENNIYIMRVYNARIYTGAPGGMHARAMGRGVTPSPREGVDKVGLGVIHYNKVILDSCR